MNPNDVTAVVLAAGTSTRMWPLGDKHLISFAGQRLLGMHLSHLKMAGVGRTILVASPENEARLRDEAGAMDSDVRVAVQAGPAGMAGAALAAISQLGENDLDKPLYITQPHDVVEARLHTDVLAAASTGAYAFLAGCVTDRYFPGGYLALEGERITAIVEKPDEGSEPSDVVTIVAHLFTDARPLFHELQRQAQEAGGDDVYERALGLLMTKHPFSVVRYAGRWQPVKYPWNVLDVTALLLEHVRSGEVDLGPRYRQLEPGVFVGEDVTLHGGCHLAAPVVLGHGVVVGNNALVRESMAGDRSVIGFGSEVARSYLGERCYLHANYVGDSVIESDVLLGFGTVSANFRLDEKTVKSSVGGERIDSRREKLGMIVGAGAKLGVSVNVMPGVKIGAGAVIGPGQTIMDDVGDNVHMLPERSAGP